MLPAKTGLSECSYHNKLHNFWETTGPEPPGRARTDTSLFSYMKNHFHSWPAEHLLPKSARAVYGKENNAEHVIKYYFVVMLL